MLKINEIFFSAQGEGSRVGVPSLFIRLAGCTAGCPYCDTKESWLKGEFKHEDDILKIVDSFKKEYKDFQIVITGGEPFEQDIKVLVDKIKKRDFFIAVETNGMHYYKMNIDWYAVSPKDVCNYEINKNLQNEIDEIKLVVNTNLTIDVIKNIRNINDNFPIYLQPDYYDSEKYKSTFLLYKNCLVAGIKNIRLGYQLHRLYGIE